MFKCHALFFRLFIIDPLIHHWAQLECNNSLVLCSDGEGFGFSGSEDGRQRAGASTEPGRRPRTRPPNRPQRSVPATAGQGEWTVGTEGYVTAGQCVLYMKRIITTYQRG